MKGPFLEINLGAEVVSLLHQKAMFRPEKDQLVLADMHLGKATHFRKKGIAMPAESHINDIERLAYLLRQWKPESVILLGDLFHSEYNQEWLWFEALLREFDATRFHLVMGNHDILPEQAYKIRNLERHETIEEDFLLFTHEPLTKFETKINVCGHLHPGMHIAGKAREGFRLPCFSFNGKQFILPAFGDLTGLYLLDQEEGSDYYLVTRDTIVKL